MTSLCTERCHVLQRRGVWSLSAALVTKKDGYPRWCISLHRKLHVATAGRDGLAWEGLHGGCLVTTNLLKCLTNIRDRAVFWQWIVKSALYCSLSQPWTTNSLLGVTHTWYTCHDNHLTARKLVSQWWVCLCVSYLRRVYLVTLSLRWIPATFSALLQALSGCFSYSGLSWFDPRIPCQDPSCV